MDFKSNENIENQYWFVLSTPYLKDMEIRALLDNKSTECFVPLCEVSVVCNGNNITKRIPAIPGILFVKTEAEKIRNIIKKHAEIRCMVRRDGDTPRPMTLSESDMKCISEKTYSLQGISIDDIIK